MYINVYVKQKRAIVISLEPKNKSSMEHAHVRMDMRVPNVENVKQDFIWKQDIVLV